MQNPVELVPIVPPADALKARREAAFAKDGEKRTRYSLPTSLSTASPVGYRVRVAFTREEARAIQPLLSLARPSAFVTPEAVREQELFEETSLGILTARQSTNYRGHKQVTLGPEHSAAAADALRAMGGSEPVLDGAAYTHVVLSKPYRTPFTMLLTFIGHKPVVSLATVPLRAWNKRFHGDDDIPTIGYLQHLHLGILADAMERAALIASDGRRMANVIHAPFCTPGRDASALEKLAGVTPAMKSAGWRIHIVAQVGQVADGPTLPRPTWRKLGANLLALRSARIQPGVNAEAKAPPQYQTRQEMRVPDELAFMAGRAAYNAFEHWTGLPRDQAKKLLMMERVDVVAGGKERLREIRKELADITDRVVENIPLWADLPLMKKLSSNAARGKKAFALAGQRIYIGGLDQAEVAAAEVPWDLALRAFGAAAARSALTCELSGCIDLPDDCDLLSGICLMAGPVNQNDIGKEFFGYRDLLKGQYPDRDPTSLLVWTLKAKTVADPIGNEEQLMNPKRKGALVDLRCGPHHAVEIEGSPMRRSEGRTNQERAFSDVGNFVTAEDGTEIPGNRGSAWPTALSNRPVW